MLSRFEKQPDFLTPEESVQSIVKYVGSRYESRLIIADAVHRGEILVNADAVWQIDDCDPTDPWDKLIEQSSLIQRDAIVEAQTWHASYCWPDEVRYWRWKEGNLILNASEDPKELFVGLLFENVTFERASVLRLVGKTERSGAGGRKPDRERWALFWINVLFEFTDKFEWQKFETKHQLKQAFLACNEDVFSENNVDYAVRLAWERIVLHAATDRASEE